MKFFLFFLFFAQTLLADVQIENGFFVVDGNPQTSKPELLDTDIIFCHESCRIIDNESFLDFRFKGFNTVQNVMLITQSEEKLKSFRGSVKSRKTAEPNLAKKKEEEAPASQGDDEKPRKEEKAALNPEKSAPEGFKYVFPYPKEKTIFLYKSAGKIFFQPKAICQSSCKGSVYIVETGFKQSIQFAKGERPLWSIEISKNILKSEIQWSFIDGDEKKDHTFSVWKLSKENFRDALAADTSIEVMQ